jgi:putative membrane protein
MRYVYLAMILLLTVAVLVFTFQNFPSVTVVFLSIRITLPLALLVPIVYVLGMLTGGALWALLRTSYRGAFVQR